MWGMLGGMVGWSLGFVIVRRVLGVLGLGGSPVEKDVEIAVLRHQIVVLNLRCLVLGSLPAIGWFWSCCRGFCLATCGRCSS